MLVALGFRAEALSSSWSSGGFSCVAFLAAGGSDIGKQPGDRGPSRGTSPGNTNALQVRYLT